MNGSAAYLRHISGMPTGCSIHEENTSGCIACRHRRVCRNVAWGMLSDGDYGPDLYDTIRCYHHNVLFVLESEG